jgi:hypothetical protein
MGFFSKLFLWFFFTNLFWYFIGSFIAFDFNPTNWWLINNTFGRIVTVFIEVILFSISVKASDEI